MKQLLIIRDRIKVFAGKNEAWLLPLLKFLMTFILMLRINSKLGYMARLTGTPIALIVALAGSFLPINLTIVILGLITVAHIYAVSLVTAMIVLVLFVILFLLYYRFASQDAVGSLLLQVAYVFNIPSVIPVSMGLTGTPISMVSVGCGAIVHYVLAYVSEHAKELATAGGDELLAGFKEIIDALIGNRIMYVVAVAYAVTVLVVYIIRRLPVNFCWYIAIGVGSLVCFFVLLVGGRSMGVSIPAGSAFVGVLISIILNTILQFFCFSLDYNRTEKVQFEDDEYYYYVKAIPKRNSGITDNVIRPTRKKAPSSKVLVRVPAKGSKVQGAASESSPYRSRPARPSAKPSAASKDSARTDVIGRAIRAAKAGTSGNPVQGKSSVVKEEIPKDTSMVMTFVDDDAEGK